MIKLTEREFEILQDIVKGYIKQRRKEESDAISYYQYDLYDNIQQELVDAKKLITELYGRIEIVQQ